MQSALARIAEVALSFGPTVAFDAAKDVVWVDIGGCAHLHGGEGALLRALEANVRALGHACRIAVADGPRIAAAVVSFAPIGSTRFAIVPRGKGAEAMRGLSIEALALTPQVTEWLSELGLRTCGDLQKLPRPALGVRLGACACDVFLLLDGEDRAPLTPWRPPEVIEEHFELEWGARGLDAMAFVLKTVCDRLSARLRGRALGVTELSLALTLDRALCEETASASNARPWAIDVPILLPAPIGRAEDLLAIVRARLERCELPAPVLAVALRAEGITSVPGRPLDWLAPESRGERELPRLVAALAAELGESCVGTLTTVDTWVADERTRFVPMLSATSPKSTGSLPTTLEPTRLVKGRLPLPRSVLCGARHLARIEVAEWWRRGVIRSDWFAAWLDGGARGGPRSAPLDGGARGEPRSAPLDGGARGEPRSAPLDGGARGGPRSAPLVDREGATGRGYGLGWVELGPSPGSKQPELRGWID